ncbi:hypothetical protein ACOMHN_011575 [Nucella lapillus]
MRIFLSRPDEEPIQRTPSSTFSNKENLPHPSPPQTNEPPSAHYHHHPPQPPPPLPTTTMEHNNRPATSPPPLLPATTTSSPSSFNATPMSTDNASDDYYPYNHSADYDYDYELTDYALPLDELLPVTLVYGTTLILGLTGNLLVIVVVARYRSMKNITNTFLLSLASSDLLLVSICIPVKFAAFFTFSWTFGEVLCKGVHYLQNVSALCSVLTLTAMGLERYYAILHPMRAKYVCTVGKARRAIVVLWVTSVILALPIIFQTPATCDASPRPRRITADGLRLVIGSPVYSSPEAVSNGRKDVTGAAWIASILLYIAGEN